MYTSTHTKTGKRGK